MPLRNYKSLALFREPYINESAKALEEIWTPVILPDIVADQSITLSNSARSLLRDIASEFTYEQRLLLSCTRYSFTKPWDFYYHAFGNKDTMLQCIEDAVRLYNMVTRGNMTKEEGFSCFTQLKDSTGKRLMKEQYQLDIHRTVCYPEIEVTSEAHVELLVNQTYDFCLACISDTRYDLGRPLLKFWLMREGWRHTSKSISELDSMSSSTTSPADLEQANRLATVAFCGLAVQEKRQGFRYLSQEEILVRQSFITSLSRFGLIKVNREPKEVDTTGSSHLWSFLGDGLKLTLRGGAQTQSCVWGVPASLLEGLPLTE